METKKTIKKRENPEIPEKSIKNSKEFLINKEISKLKKEVLQMGFELETKKHEMRLKELEFSRENDKIHHENEMEKLRIKSAEIRKDREWRSNRNFAENYVKHG